MAEDKIEYSRLKIKRSGIPGIRPTIPSSGATTLNEFLPTDIFVGEFFLNEMDDLLFIRTENGIQEITISGSTGSIQNLSQVLQQNNTTSGNDIFISIGDTIQFESLSSGITNNILGLDVSGNTILTTVSSLTTPNLEDVLSEGNFTGENNIIVTSGTTIIYESLENPQYRGLLGFDSFGSTIAVSPDDLTPKPYYGQISNITGGTFSIDTAGTYKEMKITSNLDLNYEIIKGVNYQMSLMNDSDEDILLDVYGSADITAGNNKVLGIKLAVNGIPIDETECRAPTGVGTSFAKLVTSWMVILNPEDEVSLFVTNFTNTGDITVDRARLVGKRVLHRVDSISPAPLL